jgi:MFS family permease
MIPLALVVFCASGFSALLYQVIWQRTLGIFSGADVYSATIIVAAFMGGLGAGHVAGGQVADRVSRRASLVLFGAAELAIALFGLFSAALYYDVLYQRLGQLDLTRAAMATILFGGLLWPTFFMGASLPLLARAITDRIDHAASTIGALYGVNTLGAAAGACIATWVLLPGLGLEGSLRIGAAINLACALVVLPLSLRIDGPAERAAAADGQLHTRRVSGEGSGRRRLWLWALVSGLAGFVALSYEITWGSSSRRADEVHCVHVWHASHALPRRHRAWGHGRQRAGPTPASSGRRLLRAAGRSRCVCWPPPRPAR